jgi:thioredoxin-like negative regulator of GroEL
MKTLTPLPCVCRCGHCKALAPDWAALGDAYAGAANIVIGDVDCTVEESICSDFEVRGYPTLKYFTPETGAKGEDYTAGRDLESLKAFVDETLTVKCQLADQEKCSQKEKDYMAKMQGKGTEEVTSKP